MLGNYADPGMEVEIALRKHELPHVFPPSVEALAKKFPTLVRKRRLEGTRRPHPAAVGDDRRRDGEGLRRRGLLRARGQGFPACGWRIADVSHYVQATAMRSTSRRVSAATRSTFPRRVIPMLPEELSNGLCSLNPQVERLCLACEMAIGPRGDDQGLPLLSGGDVLACPA